MELKEIYTSITKLENYAPSERVNGLFSALVRNVIDPMKNEVLTRKECGCLQKICSHAEYEMEKFWAKEIIQGNKNLKDFVYYENYRDLTRLEWSALISCTEHEHHEVLFVGSGPLPMTAVVLALNHNIKSILLDNDPVAVELSRAVISVLGLEHMISVICADGNAFDGYDRFNVIFVAALAGADPRQKEEIFAYIRNNAPAHCHIVARSSWGRRRLLYPPLPRSVYKLFKPIIEISPYNEIVNSVVIFKK